MIINFGVFVILKEAIVKFLAWIMKVKCINWEWQNKDDSFQRIRGERKGKAVISALVAIEPHSHAIRAFYGVCYSRKSTFNSLEFFGTSSELYCSQQWLNYNFLYFITV